MSGQARYRRPESVLVVVYTRALEVLLLERVTPSGFWQSVTGTLEWDETPADAAAREVLEETGIAPAGLRDAGISNEFAILPEWRPRYAPGTESNLEHVWYLALDEPQPVRLNRSEHRRHLWLPLERAITRVSSWTNRAALEALSADGRDHEPA